MNIFFGLLPSGIAYPPSVFYYLNLGCCNLVTHPGQSKDFVFDERSFVASVAKNKHLLTEQSSKMSLGLNLFEDPACISTPLSALILSDIENPLFLSLQASESLQLYLILWRARSLSKRRNSN